MTFKKNKNEQKHPTCIAAVSGGPDSMYLLDFLLKKGERPAVCHVNYHKRDSAKRDEQIVRTFCKEHDLPLLLLHPRYTGGNFQAWARDVRYAFFETAAKAYQVKTVYVAHHQDDLLETWMLQKKRNAIVSHYGLASSLQRGSVIIKRPLLGMSKAQILERCKTQNIPYGIDESNLQNDYARNRIRHSVIETADDNQRKIWLAQIESDNQNLQTFALPVFDEKGSTAFPHNWQALEAVFAFLCQKHFSKGNMQDILEKLQKGNEAQIEDLYAWKQDERLFLCRKEEIIPFWIENEMHLHSLCQTQTAFQNFSFAVSGETIDSFSCKEEDFPLTVQKGGPSFQIRMRFGNKKLGRFYIDRHIPKAIRRTWPVIVNRFGAVIFVPGLGCDALHFASDSHTYMLKSTLSNLNSIRL